MTHRDAQSIIQRVLNGDTDAFALLLEHHEAHVYGLVVRLLGDEAEAEDVTQEAFLQAFTHLRDYHAEADFGSWLYRIAYHAALMHLRRRRVVPLPIDDRLADSISDAEADAALDEMTEQRIGLLQQALTRLSPEDRTAITLFYYDERPVRDIAYVLSTTVTNVTTRLHRARKRLYLLIKQMEYEQQRQQP